MEKQADKLKIFFEEGFSYFKNQNTEKLNEWFSHSEEIIQSIKKNKIAIENEIWLNLFYSPHTIMLLVSPKNGKIIEANKAAVKFYGYTHKQLLTKNIQDINTLTESEIEIEMEAAFNEKRNHFRFVHRLADGRLKRVNVYSAKIRKANKKYLFSQIYDVNDLYQQKELINKLQQAIEQSPTSILITDLDGKIEYVNPYFERITKYSLDEIKGKNPKFLKSGYTSQKEYKKLWKTILSGDTWQGEFLNISKDRKQFWERVLISPIKNKNGEIVNFLGIKEIITKEKKLISKLKDSEKQLKKSLKQKNKLFSIIGHDLRNPFNVILGYGQLLETHYNQYSTEKIQTMFHFLNDATEKANNLLENLLRWGALNEDKFHIFLQDIGLFKLIQQSAASVNSQAQTKNIQIIIQGDTNLKVKTDVEIVSTIIRNILSNAIKYSPKNSKINIEIKQKTLNLVSLSIEDFGIGMNEKTLKSILKRKKLISSKGTQEEKGTGLGLSLVLDFIYLIKSEIDIKTTLGKGTKVSFTLNLAPEK